MFGPRRMELLRKAAAMFKDMADPFSTAFLLENNVTMDECDTLSNDIALLIESFLACPKEVQFTFLLSGISANERTDTKITPQALWEGFTIGKGQRKWQEIGELLKDQV